MRSVPILILVGMLAVLVAHAEIIEGIVAIVNDEIITHSELEEYLAPHLLNFDKGSPGWVVQEKIARLRKELVEELIKEKLLLSEAKREGVVVRDEEIDVRLEELRAKLGTDGKFQLQLSKENLTEESLKKRIRERMLVRKLIDFKIGSKIGMLSEEEVREFFERDKNKFVEPERVEMRQIMVEVKGEGKWLEAKKKIEDIYARLLKGEDFSTLAKKYSDGPFRDRGGNLGFISRMGLLPEFEKAISTLQVGEISEIIRTETGFHVIKLESRKDARQREFSEMRTEIENYLYRLKVEEALSKWIEELKEKAYIQVMTVEE